MNSEVNDKLNSYQEVTTEELRARVAKLSDELRGLRIELKERELFLATESWKNLQESHDNYRNVINGSF